MHPLWDLYAAHFSGNPADEKGPASEKISEALARVGHGAIDFGAEHVRFQRQGMAITLNGIGQGYITDRVAENLPVSIDPADSAILQSTPFFKAMTAEPFACSFASLWPAIRNC